MTDQPTHSDSPSRTGRGAPGERPRLSADELAALQLVRLRWTLRHAYDNVPFYRRRFDEAGVRPEDCRSLSDLAGFPHTTKDDLRRNHPYGMLAVPPTDLRRIHASSGTTGVPTVVGYTRRDLDMWAEVVARSLRAAGARPGQRAHIAYGYGLFTGGLGAHHGAELLGCTVIPASGGMSARQVRLIRDLRPEIVLATPSYLLTLLDEFDRQGVDPRDAGLLTGVLGAEPWTEGMRAEIEGRSGLTAVDIYGLSEIIGPGVAQEFPEAVGALHVWEDHFYPEVLDPGGTPVAPGERGELAITTLTREAMPLIRYRTGDLSALTPGAGVPFRRMARITGRTDDLLILRGVNLYPTQVEELVLRTRGLSPHFVLELTREARLDQLTIRAEAVSGLAADRWPAVGGELSDLVRGELGLRVGVEVVAPGTLERSSGKARRVLDNRETTGPA
ncbi:phenylacetate--CoA ligase family protein [Actinoalloteichus caeruleus]|uniref:phenylacetate--CoA ligase family protein n=1 Tax=Actinoalloteichus cyanogriseus TaxID=2893586 RepID=UPI003AAF3938